MMVDYMLPNSWVIIQTKTKWVQFLSKLMFLNLLVMAWKLRVVSKDNATVSVLDFYTYRFLDAVATRFQD